MDAKIRLKHATEALALIESAGRTLIDLHENCRIILFSPLITDQLGESYATNAFHRCRLAVFDSLLVRLCAVWDKPSGITLPAEISLPTVAKLLKSDDVVKLIVDFHEPHTRRLGAMHWSGEHQFRKQLARVDRVASSSLVEQICEYRNKYLAHSLTETRLEKKRGLTIDLPKYRQVAELLGATIHLIHVLQIDVTGVNFLWGSQRNNSKKCAEELWTNCKFII